VILREWLEVEMHPIITAYLKWRECEALSIRLRRWSLLPQSPYWAQWMMMREEQRALLSELGFR
jgi:hypothetical protein